MNASSPARPANWARTRKCSTTTAASPSSWNSSPIDAGVTDVWRLHGAGKFKETVPVLDDRGHSKLAEVERDCEVDVALRWGIGYDTTVRSFVNIISTPKGGTHQSGFEQALVKTFRKAVETNARKLKAGNDKIEKDDIFAGLTAVLTVRLAEPQFEGQTKEILGTSAVRAIVARVVEKEITAKLNSAEPQRQGAVGAAAGEDRQRDEVPHLGPRAQGNAAPQERAGDVLHAHEARGLPHRRRRPLRTVHRGGRLGPRHRQAGAVLRLPGAAADPRQDPERPEGLGGGHALQRRMRRPDPGGRRRLRAQLRHRGRPLRQGHPDDGRRRRRRPHPHAAAHALLPLHAPHGRAGPGLRRRAAAAPRGSHQRRARRPTR